MKISLKSKQKIYLEIASEIKRNINLGILKPDDKLPSVRSLSLELGINPNTVDKAYDVLVEEGIIVVYPQKGAFVSKVISEEIQENEILNQLIAIKRQGIKKNKMIELLEKAYKGDEND